MPIRSINLYLLSQIEVAAMQGFQDRLVHEIQLGGYSHASLVLCEHPYSLSSGCDRESNSNILSGSKPKYNMNRGGGLIPHGPGQIGIYFNCPLKYLTLSPLEYRDQFEKMLLSVSSDIGLSACERIMGEGVFCPQGQIAYTAIRVSQGMTYFGGYLNISLAQQQQYFEENHLSKENRWTSLSHALNKPVEISHVKTTLMNEIRSWLTEAQVMTFTTHPILKREIRQQYAFA